MVVDVVKLLLGVAAPCLFVLLARSAPIEDLALVGQALIARNRWPSLVGAVAARNRTVQREREAKDCVANATTIRRKSEQIVVETLKPREEDDSDTATDDDDENLNALDDWLARPDQKQAPVPTEVVEDVS